jgi:CoA:oxalate CoA-transferase
VTGPLDGIRVLDLTNFLSGPYCTQLLADLGAEVIKVEMAEGDSSRAIPPHFIGGTSAYFLANNRNKSSIVIDLKNPAGLQVARRLIDESDVVVENFRPGTLARLGLDPAEARELKPDLIWASISGFGQDGPWRNRPAYDMIVQALSGAMSITGEPGRPAVRLGPPMGDLAASLFAAIGILAAIIGRGGSGEGRTVDVSMLDAQLSLLSYQAVYSMVSGTTPDRQGTRHDSIPTYRSFTGGDGREFVVTANTERMWHSMCEVIGRPDLSADPRFGDAGMRLRNKESLWAELEPAFLAEDAAHWVERLVAANVPAALIKTIPEALEDASSSGRGMIVEMSSDQGEEISTMATPITFIGEQPAPAHYPPRLGEHTRTVLRDVLKATDAEIDALVSEGAVRDELATTYLN